MPEVAARRAVHGLTPRTLTDPASGFNSPHASRSDVVLPAPSGPMSPNISPLATSNETPASAVTAANRLTTPSRRITASAAMTGPRATGRRKPDIDRDTRLEDTLPVVDRHFDPVDELGALVGRLGVARRELRLG